MDKIQSLFSMPLQVANIGVETFFETLQVQHIDSVQVDWRPPAGGDLVLMSLIEQLDLDLIQQANFAAFDRINAAEPMLVDVKFAHEVLALDKHSIGHAGPPIEWAQMCGPMQGAIMGAIVYEGLASSLAEAEVMASTGQVTFVSNHSLGAVGPMTGMITYSMPLWEVRNEAFGNVAYCTFNEGLGKVMRFGANDDEVVARLKWLEQSLAPVMKAALAKSGPISMKVLVAKALAMGDEMHQRNTGATSLFIRELMRHVVAVTTDNDELERVTSFMTGNDQFFLNLAMATGKAIMDPVKHIPHSTVVTAMSRNGTNFGIKISALGDQWFEAPVNTPMGLYFPGYSEADANPDMGDSTIIETFGIGGFAMGSAPAVVRFVGASSAKEAVDYSLSMQEICMGLSPHFVLPALDFSGTATAIDAIKVIQTGILPVINTGMAHKKPGVGQVGAGIVTPPMTCFTHAIRAFAEQEKGQA